MKKLSQDERLLVETGINRYKLLGPGLVWLQPWHKILTRLYVGPQSHSLRIDEVQTTELVPVDVTVKLLYQVSPANFHPALLPRMPSLDETGWSSILKWRTEHIIRHLFKDVGWRKLAKSTVFKRLDRQLALTLADDVAGIGLTILSVNILDIKLPANLQRTIIEAERDRIEPHGRALVWKEYFETFGDDLATAMPYIIQWELLNTMRKTNNSKFLVSDFSFWQKQGRGVEPVPPLYQMQLPLSLEQ